MKILELAISMTGTGLQVYLCYLLLVRGFYRQFRFFTACAIFSVTEAMVLIVLRNHEHPYLYVYWIFEVFAVVLIFFALQESFYLVFRNFLSLPGFKLLFPGIGILMVVVAALRAFLQPPPDVHFWTATLISLEIAVDFLQFGLFCLFIILVRFFNMRWRQHAFGVVLGFGITLAGTLVVLLLRSEFGNKLDPIVRITPPLAYIVTVVVWLATFLRAEPSHPMQDRVLTFTPEQMISEIRRYTRTVKGILER